MLREFLKAKIHGGRITCADLEYEGSLGIDADWMKTIGLRPFESVEIYNVTNGERIRTYAIELPAGSRRLESNGAAAHKIRLGDRVIVAAYAWLTEQELQLHKPKILILDAATNQVKNFYEARLDPTGAQTPLGEQMPSDATRFS